ncbi:MAG: hypothetical protein FWH11_01430 [Micrococcales bacterium]|nr:hypothetical protein [Micrococcales bacterium]
MGGATYSDEVGRWPGRDAPVTAEALLRYQLVRGLQCGHVLWEHGGEMSPMPVDVPASEGLRRVSWLDYIRLVDVQCWSTDVCYLLGRLRQADPQAADEAAEWLVDMAEAGESLEWLHETALDVGIDVDQVCADQDAAWQDRPSTCDLVAELVELRAAVAEVAADLVQMDADTGISLAAWPSACRVVTLAGAWPDDDQPASPEQEGNHDG